MEKQTIGRRDKADFPGLKLRNLAVKIDTGAYTSSIHCHRITVITSPNGEKALKFTLLDPSHKKYNNREFTVSDFRQKTIRNSSGQAELRYVIRTSIILFENEYSIDMSLSERGEMKFPVLLGRQLLRGKFLVDSAAYNLSWKEKKLKNQLSRTAIQ